MYLSDFVILNPPYTYPQEEGLAKLAFLHAHAEPNNETLLKHVQTRIDRVCCKQDKIGKRQTSVNEEWLQTPRHFGDRSRYYMHFVDEVFNRFYPENRLSPPAEIIHVTCTGYNSPSAAQKTVLKRGWTKQTQVTHAYHMGCMAAVPAVRIAFGFAAAGKPLIDIVHTELCSLHLNPALHTDEQLVAQSLFADGFIKYSLTPKRPNQASLKVLTIYEELIPQTDELMKWECEDWGLKMTLRKEIPVWIARAIEDFIQRLEKECKHSLQDAFYAVHPGGPKIIELIGKKLNLTEKQIETSVSILFEYGNMSSATLPHIWERMVQDPHIPDGSLIVGIAFGPGLCMCGIVLQKESS